MTHFFPLHFVNHRVLQKLTTQNSTLAIFDKKSKWNGEVTLDQDLILLKVKVKQSRYRPEVAQRVPGS
jgi:hypothetical protein